jgi:hypothetical protein
MSLKFTRGMAVVSLAVGMFASCATLPVSETARTSTYTNVHEVQFEYPHSWQLEDMSKTYGSLAQAEQAGAAYIQVFSYNPMLVGNPTEEVSRTQVKIAILLSRNPDKLDFQKVLRRIGDGLVEKSVFSIHGKQAYRLHYQIHSEERNDTLDILAIEYFDRDLYARFICYPWNSSHEKEFEALVRSFRYKGK